MRRAFLLSPILAWCLFAAVVAGGLGGFPRHAAALTNVSYHGATGCYVPIGAPNSTTLAAVIAELTWDACVLLPRTMAGSASGNWAITGNLTVPSRLTLVVERGPKLVPAAGITLTLASPPRAGDYQIFNADETTTGAVRFTQGAIGAIPAAWFGVTCDNTVDNSLLLMAALNSAPEPVPMDVESTITVLPAGICKFTTALALTRSVHLRGQGGGRAALGLHFQTLLNYTGTGTFITLSENLTSGSVLEGFGIDHNPTGVTAEVAIDIQAGSTANHLTDVTIILPTTPFSIAGIRVGHTTHVHSNSLDRVFVRTSAPIGLLCEDVQSALYIHNSTFHHHTTANVQLGKVDAASCKEVHITNSRFENDQGGDGIVIYRGEFINIRGSHFEIQDPNADGRASIRVPSTATSNHWLTVSHTRFGVLADATGWAMVLDNDAQIVSMHHNVFGGGANAAGYINNLGVKELRLEETYLDTGASPPLVSITAGSTIENVSELGTYVTGTGRLNGFAPERLCQSFEVVASVTTNNETLATCTIPASTISSSAEGFTVHAFGLMADDADAKTVTLTIDGATVSTLAVASAAGGDDTWEIRCTGGKSTAAAGLNLLCHSLVDDDQSTTAVLYEASVSQGVTLSGTWLATDVVISVVANGTDADDIVLRGFSVMLLR